MQSQAERYGVEPWLVMFAWLLKHPAGILPIVGSTTPARIAAAPRALALDYRREDWYRLLEARRGQPQDVEDLHRRHRHPGVSRHRESGLP